MASSEDRRWKEEKGKEEEKKEEKEEVLVGLLALIILYRGSYIRASRGFSSLEVSKWQQLGEAIHPVVVSPESRRCKTFARRQLYPFHRFRFRTVAHQFHFTRFYGMHDLPTIQVSLLTNRPTNRQLRKPLSSKRWKYFERLDDYREHILLLLQI